MPVGPGCPEGRTEQLQESHPLWECVPSWGRRIGQNGPATRKLSSARIAMTVHCQHCSTRYFLPPHLMGPRGARVRCPECQGTFTVSRERTNGEASRLADELLSALAARLGEALE